MRKEKYVRKTNETDISIQLNIDGIGKSEVDTGISFFDHMSDQTQFSSQFSLISSDSWSKKERFNCC